MKFTVSTTDPRKLAGIAAARAAYNAALPEQMQTVEVSPAVPASEGQGAVPAVTEQQPIVPKPGTLATDQEYVAFVMDRAFESYANQYAGA